MAKKSLLRRRFDILREVTRELEYLAIDRFDISTTKYHISIKGYYNDPKNPTPIEEVVYLVGVGLKYTSSIDSEGNIFNMQIDIRD